jgi:hypothetical protein
MLEKVKEYFENEYKQAEELLTRKDRPFWAKPKQVCENALVRCLGVTMFVQSVGVSYSDVSVLYDELKEKLEKLKESIDN